VVDDDDIRAYLDRLGVEREPPSVDALDRLHRAHLEHVPYETTWIHAGRRHGVDRTESLRRIAHQRTGGYCFHLNGALSLLLETLGYDVSLHVGGVHGSDGPLEERMLNHLVLQVHGLPSGDNPDGDWYVDAGLGDALHGPLPLVEGRYRQGPFEFEISVSDSSFGDWHFGHDPLGTFTGMLFRSAPAAIEEFAQRNEYLSTSPESGFVQTLTVQRRDSGGVDILRGQVLHRVETAVSGERTLSSRNEWFEVLNELFELPLRDYSAEEIDMLWERVNATHEAWLESRG
jgi:N-hydroxyarylamine O-acetyltransferase